MQLGNARTAPVVVLLLTLLVAFSSADTTTVENAIATDPPHTPVDEGSQLPFVTIMFCAKAFGLPLLLFIVFVALATVCDDHLAPALEVVAEQLQLPHDVACATFLAFGSSAPEICINIVATARGKVAMSMGAIMGSGIIAYTVIPAACVLVSSGQMLHLETVPLLRDVLFYAVSVILFVYFVHNGQLGPVANSVMVGLFFVYLLVMYVLGKFYHDPRAKEVGKDEEQVHFFRGSQMEESKENYGSILIEGEIDSESKEECLSVTQCITRCLGACSSPIEVIYGCTIPPLTCLGGGGERDEQEQERLLQKWWPATLFMSLVWIAVLSEAVLEITMAFADLIGMPHHIAGLTFVALGAQVPDTFASISVAKQGEGPSSISNAIGSQVINILLGMGLPFLVFNMATGRVVTIKGKDKSGGVALSGAMLASLIVLFLLLCFRLPIKHRMLEKKTGHRASHTAMNEDRKPALSLFDAAVLLLLYVVTIGVLVSHEVVVALKS